MSKRVSPYTYLQTLCRNWARSVVYRHTVAMFDYTGVEGNHYMRDLYERTIAADELGYQVIVSAKHGEKMLHVHYVKRFPDPPWEIAP